MIDVSQLRTHSELTSLSLSIMMTKGHLRLYFLLVHHDSAQVSSVDPRPCLGFPGRLQNKSQASSGSLCQFLRAPLEGSMLEGSIIVSPAALILGDGLSLQQ